MTDDVQSAADVREKLQNKGLLDKSGIVGHEKKLMNAAIAELEHAYELGTPSDDGWIVPKVFENNTIRKVVIDYMAMKGYEMERLHTVDYSGERTDIGMGLRLTPDIAAAEPAHKKQKR